MPGFFTLQRLQGRMKKMEDFACIALNLALTQYRDNLYQQP